MQDGGGNPFAGLGNMGNIMENVKKAQQLVQVEAAKAQEELAAYVSYVMDVTAQRLCATVQKCKACMSMNQQCCPSC